MFSVIIQFLLLIVVMRPNRQSQDAVYVFAVGVVAYDSDDSEATAKAAEARSSASATYLVRGHRDFIFQLLVSSCFVCLYCLCQSLPLSLMYADTIIRLCMIFSKLTLISLLMCYCTALFTDQLFTSWCYVWLFTLGCASELCFIWILFLA